MLKKGAYTILIHTSVEQWESWKHTCQFVPFVISKSLSSDGILSWETVWEQCGAHTILLESGKGGRYTYLGHAPDAVVSGKGRNGSVVHLDNHGQVTQTQRLEGTPIQAVRQWLKQYRGPKVQGVPPFLGGLAGFWSYDVARYIEKLPVWALDDLETPDYAFLQLNRLFIVDHQKHKLYVSVMTEVSEEDAKETLHDKYAVAREIAKSMEHQWDNWMKQARMNHIAQLRKNSWDATPLERQLHLHTDLKTICDFPETAYTDAVKKIQDYIRAGDVFQVNLSLRQHRKLRSRPATIYEWLRIINPSPYMAFMQLPHLQIVSGSPELLVKLEQGQVSTRPIAGTRRRGRDGVEEDQFIRELRENEKERAEHIMLVDLLRNDLGRIARYGSVKVDELMVIESYSHVMHLVSEVSGELATEYDLFDVMEAVFPGGTITGAPKIRTMEIIEELEPVRRGIYTGSIGWIDYHGNMEFNIVIRTLVMQNHIGYVQSGAGIVIDSSPTREYKESLSKAKALWKAIELSESEGER